MQKCEGCGNEYDKSFQVVMGGKAHVFDSFGMRDPCARAVVRALRREDRRPWARKGRPDVLLRSLRRG